MHAVAIPMLGVYRCLTATVLFTSFLAGCEGSQHASLSGSGTARRSAERSAAATESARTVASAPHSASASHASSRSVSSVSSVPPTPSADPGFFVPESVAQSSDRVPFVLLLHGYGGTGASIARHFGFTRLANEKRFVYYAPDGTVDAKGSRFWNAQPACCDFDRRAPDHVAELGRIIAQAKANAHVDADRIYVVGYSNGGFMAHRLACDVAGIAGIASVAGAAVPDAAACANAPKTILEVHGDADPVVDYAGGQVLHKAIPAHLGVVEGMKSWARRAGCSHDPKQDGAPIDLDPDLPGAETHVSRFDCAAGVRFFRVSGGTHNVAADPLAMKRILSDLMEAKRP